MIDLVMHVQGVGYRDAATWLRRINEGEEERPPAPPIKLDYLPLVDRGFKLPAEVDFLPIDKWPTLARRYAEERGFAGQVKRWRIGVAVDGRLAGRIAFVTQRRGGTPTNYSARTFINDPVRYLSAPEECNPDPRVLFGEHRWSNINDRIFLCEGAINALAVERAFMFDDVAAMHGSNVLPVYSLKLSRYKTVVCMTDPDPAGEKAASILQRSLLSHVQFIRVKLPIGHDAASIPPEELQAAVAASL
jgi:DNA primase